MAWPLPDGAAVLLRMALARYNEVWAVERDESGTRGAGAVWARTGLDESVSSLGLPACLATVRRCL